MTDECDSDNLLQRWSHDVVQWNGRVNTSVTFKALKIARASEFELYRAGIDRLRGTSELISEWRGTKHLQCGNLTIHVLVMQSCAWSAPAPCMRLVQMTAAVSVNTCKHHCMVHTQQSRAVGQLSGLLGVGDTGSVACRSAHRMSPDWREQMIK